MMSRKRRAVSRIAFAITAITVAFGGLTLNQTAIAEASSASVQIKYMDWKDVNRDRVIPVKIYMPANVSAPSPVAIFSHGLGGSREAASYLGNFWAEHGYIGVFIQHPGSDESFWKPSVQAGSIPDRSELIGKFRSQLTNPMHAVNRAQDVHFIIDKLEQLNAKDPIFKGKFNLDEIAIAGHSFGSWTALTASGQRMITASGRDVSSGDPRIKAAIYLSPTSSRKGQDPSKVFGAIQIPGLHLTGTKDDSPVNDTKAIERRIAFDNITKSDQYLVIINDANHMVFGGGRRGNDGDKATQDLVKRTSTEFLDAYLKHDPKAKEWLLKTASGYIKPHGTYELKTASR